MVDYIYHFLFSMEEINLKDQKIKYSIRKSKKARRLRLVIYCDGSMVLTLPQFFPESSAQKFLFQKADWILKKLEYFRSKESWVSQLPKIRMTKGDYKKNKARALLLVNDRLEHYSRIYDLSYKKISIRNQKTRWGSCSRNGNLSFNYKIIYLPDNLADYIIVHELCHLGQFNHSRKFWELVAKTIPEHKKLRKEVKGF